VGNGILEFAPGHARHVGRSIHQNRTGLLITHRPGGKLAAWPLRALADTAPWEDATQLPLNARFSVIPEADLMRQVAECPRVGAIFQDGRRYTFLSGLARVACDVATSLDVQIVAVETRELAGAEDLWQGSLDAAQSG
jgi:hypothetical protein